MTQLVDVLGAVNELTIDKLICIVIPAGLYLILKILQICKN